MFLLLLHHDKLVHLLMLVVALLVYFTYGIRHSKLNNGHHQQVKYTQLDDIATDDDDNDDNTSSLWWEITMSSLAPQISNEWQSFIAHSGDVVVAVVAHPPDPWASADPQQKTQWQDRGGECRWTLQPHRLDAAVKSTSILSDPPQLPFWWWCYWFQCLQWRTAYHGFDELYVKVIQTGWSDVCWWRLRE